MDIRYGTVFDTAFESDCMALGEPDDFGSFMAIDSDGVECEFSVDMVSDIVSTLIRD